MHGEMVLVQAWALNADFDGGATFHASLEPSLIAPTLFVESQLDEISSFPSWAVNGKRRVFRSE